MTPATSNVPEVPRERLPALLRAMPKAELHIHIEGSLEPELIFELAQRNGVELPYPSVEALRAAYAFTDLQSFLDIYYAGASVLLKEQDFYDMAMAYFARAKADHVVHAELFFDPQTHTERGVAVRHGDRRPDARVPGGRERARHQRRSDHVLPAPPERRRRVRARSSEALPFRDRFIGVGLDSGERGNPPEKFARVFARCRELGAAPGRARRRRRAADIHLERARRAEGRAHRPRRALRRRLGADARLARERVPLTVCPLSNVKLCVFKTDGRAQPARRCSTPASCATVNSDDPAYFGGYINQNFIEVFEALPQLSSTHAYQLAKNSFDASFVGSRQKQRWTDALDAAFATARAS